MKSKIFALLFMCWVSPPAYAQIIDAINGMQPAPNPVVLVLNISIDEIHNRAPAGIVVRLFSDYSFVCHCAATDQQSQQTDKSGTVTFRTGTGTHEVHITGAGINETSQIVEVMQERSRDVENIVVRSKPVGGQYSVADNGASDVISAATLHIPNKAEKEFQAGSKALNKKNYDAAKKHFSSATEIYDKYSLAYNGMGVAQMALGETPAARASFEKSVQIDDHFAEGYRNLARLSLANHNFEEMDALLTKSLLSEPLNAWALTYAAYAELQLQKFDIAITHARSAHGVPHPGLASVHIVAARALEATNQPDEALKEYHLYLEEDPNGRDSARARQAIEASIKAKSK